MSVVLISPAGTGGWRANEQALAASLTRLGVDHQVRRVTLGRAERLRHPWPTGSLIVAAAARRELERALEEATPEAVIAVNPTAGMLFPFDRLRKQGIATAIRIDCPASEQFPGPAHAPHRRLERRALAAADLALTMGPLSTRSVEPLARRVAAVPLGVELKPPGEPASPPVLLTYAGQPEFKGLDFVLEAWAALGTGRRDATLAVTGVDPESAERFLRRRGIEEVAAVRWEGLLDRPEYEELLRSATAFVSASRIEGHGLAQMEALANGVPLVTTQSRGAYEAEPIARRLSPELCAAPNTLDRAIATALAMPAAARAGYAARAAEQLAPFANDQVDPALREALSALGVRVAAAA